MRKRHLLLESHLYTFIFFENTINCHLTSPLFVYFFQPKSNFNPIVEPPMRLVFALFESSEPSNQMTENENF